MTTRTRRASDGYPPIRGDYRRLRHFWPRVPEPVRRPQSPACPTWALSRREALARVLASPLRLDADVAQSADLVPTGAGIPRSGC